jgi:hypothetical protein
MAFEPKSLEAYNAASSRASWRLRLARSPDPAPYSGSASPEPPNSLGKSLSFGSPSRMRSTVS